MAAGELGRSARSCRSASAGRVCEGEGGGSVSGGTGALVAAAGSARLRSRCCTAGRTSTSCQPKWRVGRYGPGDAGGRSQGGAGDRRRRHPRARRSSDAFFAQVKQRHCMRAVCSSPHSLPLSPRTSDLRRHAGARRGRLHLRFRGLRSGGPPAARGAVPGRWQMGNCLLECSCSARGRAGGRAALRQSPAWALVSRLLNPAIRRARSRIPLALRHKHVGLIHQTIFRRGAPLLWRCWLFAGRPAERRWRRSEDDTRGHHY